MTKPIHIRLTREFLVVCANLGKMQNGSFMPIRSEQEIVNWLKSWGVTYLRQKKVLIGSSVDMQVFLYLRRLLFHRMRKEAGLQVWTVEERLSQATPKEVVNTWICQATSRMEKQSSSSEPSYGRAGNLNSYTGEPM